MATVTAWHEDEGWWVATSDDVPGDICVVFSAITGMDGWVTLRPGERISVNVEEGPQDGCPYRAVSARVSGGPPR
jgi:cold shock CspA family protein